MFKTFNTIVAHRGLNMEFPENSMEAMQAAWEAGFEWCECDVHLSVDGVPVVIHDETLDRTTIRTGSVSDIPASELRRARLRDRFGSPTQYLLPMLEDLLSEIGAGRRLLVETKSRMGAAIEPIVRQIEKRNCILQSFHHDDLAIAKKAVPTVKCAALCDTAEQAFQAQGDRFYVNHTCLTKEVVDMLSRRGEVGAWTVNEDADIARIGGMNWVGKIITDFPRDARRLLKRDASIDH